MKNQKVIPLLIQKLLETESESLQDCEECGESKSVELVEDHLYCNEKEKVELEVPTYVCRNCSNESFPADSYQAILQQVEYTKGKNYVKIELKDGKIMRYSIH